VTSQQPATGPGRRHFLSSAGLIAGAAASGAALGAGGTRFLDTRSSDALATSADRAAGGSLDGSSPSAVFEGAHQPGIVDRQPAAMRFLALDLTGSGKEALRSALQALSSAARAAMAGQAGNSATEIAAGLRPAGLTVTIGIGPSALSKAGIAVPAELRPLPAFRTDRLQASRSGGDLGVQLCAEDPMVVAAAARRLQGAAAPGVVVRWSQSGFLRTAAAAVDPSGTPRNLMGQLDGTDNPTGSRQALAVWVPAGVGPSWMAGGSYLVCRRIRMLLDSWERLSTEAQERVIGRRKASGAPLTGTAEHEDPVFSAERAGSLVIPADAHVRLAHPSNNSGATMFRRAFSFDGGLDAAGQPDLGLFFQAFQTDPHRVFVPLQTKLAEQDALNSFIRHEASAVFAVPPGATVGGFVGEGLF
jgi:dye decolorizing peroxidase